MPKYLSRNAVKGQTGINFVEEAVLGMGFKWSPGSGNLDTGIDGDIEIVDPETREAKNVLIRAQVKGRTHFEKEAGDGFEFTCTKADIDYWLGGNAPVILIVVRLGERSAWWLSVREWFGDAARRKSGKAVFDKARDRFDQHTGPKLLAMAQQYGSAAYFTPKRKSERLISNLLEATRLPASLFMAETPHRERKGLYELLKQRMEWPPREWFLKEGRLFSIHNLREEPWRSICDPGTVERIETNEWAFSQDRDIKHSFVQLLKECLAQRIAPMGLVWNKDEESYYYKATRDLRPKVVSYHSLQKMTTRRVFGAILSKKDPSRIAFYRHHGFRPYFHRLEGKWYLEITPRYVFTTDGRESHPYREEYQSKIKAIEGGAAVRGIVVMFAAILQDEKSMFAKNYLHLAFGDLAAVESEVSIDDAAWSKKDELQPSTQTELEEVDPGLYAR